ncbi:MAG: hypothetical protein ACI8Y4_002724 [Candidatus Poriferisodalaceae bacterium]|jgi:hypothetical protein
MIGNPKSTATATVDDHVRIVESNSATEGETCHRARHCSCGDLAEACYCVYLELGSALDGSDMTQPDVLAAVAMK